MNQIRRRLLVGLEKWGDLGICLGALVVASKLVQRSLWRQDTLVVQHPLREAALLAVLLYVWHASLVLAGSYRSFRLARNIEFASSLVRGLLSVTACTWLWLAEHAPSSNDQRPWRDTFVELVVWAGLCGTCLLASRIALRGWTKWLRRRGRNLRHLLIIGTNQRAMRVAKSLAGDPHLGYHLVGFVDDQWHSRVAERIDSELVGQLSEVPQLLRTLTLDEVIITLPIASRYPLIREICFLCKQQGILVRYEASLMQFGDAPSPAVEEPLQFVTLNRSAWNDWALMFKRVLDVTVSASALLLCSPLLCCIALAIKFDSAGPVFFTQERLGLGKRTFKVYKFRTMVTNAEELMGKLEHLNQSAGPTFKLRNDPRVTPLGSFLRKTSLDELPQFINVLRGHMSLVGPRPLPLRDYRGFSEDWHRRRFSVKPGITCLWQVMGRSSITFDRWMELDMSYIDTWSIWLDVKILFQTVSVVVKGSGAF